MAEEKSSEILFDLSPVLKVYKDGRFERSSENLFVPPSLDPETGVQSKDVQVSSNLNLSARLFLPKNTNKKLPLVIYIHGGAFVIGSPFHSQEHTHLNILVSESNVIVVSLDYRKAPEHPLPIAYEDVWAGFKWLVSSASQSEEWIQKYADFERAYIYGDSAGGNIAHNLAIRIGTEKMEEGQNVDINIRGLYLNSPYFWGKDPVGEESKDYIQLWDFEINNVWLYACPGSTGKDDPWANPDVDPKLSSIGCRKILYYVGGKDVLKDRGELYKEALKNCGWDGEIEVVEVEDECHCFNYLFPHSEKSKIMLKKVSSFLNQV